MAKTPVRRLVIPEVLRLGGRLVEVQTVKGLRRWDGSVGEWEEEESLISLDAGQSRNDMELTYVHEILHAIWPKIRATKAERELLDSIEEKLISKLESNLRDAILSGAFEVTSE